MDKTGFFDPTRPYGQIWGLGNVRYEQDGRLFDSQGRPVDPVELAASRIPPTLTLRQIEAVSLLSPDALRAFRWLRRSHEATPNDLVRSSVVQGCAIVRARRIFGELVESGLAEWKAENVLRIASNVAAPSWENEP